MPPLACLVSNDVVAPSMILIPADLSSIAVARAAIQDALTASGWGQSETHRVVLVTSEAVANAVEHGSQPGELVEIVFHVTADEAKVRILDSGGSVPWVGPQSVNPPSTTSVRGRGVALIKALAQKVEYRPAGRGSELRLDFARTA